MDSDRLAEAEAIIRDVLPTPASEPPRKPGEINLSLYGFSWALLGSAYIAHGDYADAERVAKERTTLAEKTFGPEHFAVAGWLGLTAETYLKQEKWDGVVPLLRRSLALHAAAGLDGPIAAGPVYIGLAEALLAQGKPQEAVALLRPIADDDAGERLRNCFAVALREAGATAEAETIEGALDRDSFLVAGVNQQEREFLQARLLAFRGAVLEADAIYQRWIKHWEDRGEQVRSDPRERDWDRILMDPLGEYARFLALHGNSEDATRVRERQRMLTAKYNPRRQQNRQ